MTLEVKDIMNGYLHKVAKKLMELDAFNSTVQFDEDPNNIGSAETSIVLVGPPVLSPQTSYPVPITDLLVPIGAVQQYSLQTGKQTIPFPELGSILKRNVAGVGMYSANFARVLTSHSDLRYSFYAWLPLFLKLVKKDSNLNLSIFPGENTKKHFVGTESELFRIPFGVCVLSGTGAGETIHAEYLERCLYQGGSKSASAGNPMVVDSASITVTRPIAFGDISTGKSLAPNTFNSKRKQITIA